jgi:hypothetical protein
MKSVGVIVISLYLAIQSVLAAPLVPRVDISFCLTGTFLTSLPSQAESIQTVESLTFIGKTPDGVGWA